MLLFINTINHKVTTLLAQVQKQPPKQLLASKATILMLKELSLGIPVLISYPGSNPSRHVCQ